MIDPEIQAEYAAQLCAVGNLVDYRTYPGIGHLAIAIHSREEVVQWVADRFAGQPAKSTCSTK